MHSRPRVLSSPSPPGAPLCVPITQLGCPRAGTRLSRSARHNAVPPLLLRPRAFGPQVASLSSPPATIELLRIEGSSWHASAAYKVCTEHLPSQSSTAPAVITYQDRKIGFSGQEISLEWRTRLTRNLSLGPSSLGATTLKGRHRSGAQCAQSEVRIQNGRLLRPGESVIRHTHSYVYYTQYCTRPHTTRRHDQCTTEQITQ